MQKSELLQQIKDFVARGLISKEELITTYEAGAKSKADYVYTRHLSISNILYFIGAGIVFIGISVLIAQNWSTLNTAAKILATFGSGIAAYFVGVLFSRYQRLDLVGQAFYFVSALVTPLGLHVVFDSAGFNIAGSGTQSLISGVLLASYLLSYLLFRKNIFTVFNIIFGTWLFFSVTNLLIGSRPLFDDLKFIEYRVLLTGLSYMLLGYHFSQSGKNTLSGALYEFGVIGFLGTALALGGWPPKQSIFWELIFPGLVMGIIFLSIYVRNKAFLVFGSIFLMVYILKITAEYFAKSLGWPFALVVAGLALMAIGYFTFYLNKKYLA